VERGSSAVMEECGASYIGIRRESSWSPEIASPDSFILLYYLLCAFFSFYPSFTITTIHLTLIVTRSVFILTILNIIIIKIINVIVFNSCLHVDTESYLIVVRVGERVYLRILINNKFIRVN